MKIIPNKMATRRFIVFTIDVEFSTHPGTVGIIGKIQGQEYGLFKILDAFERRGLRVTCFVDVYGYQRSGPETMRKICNEIRKRGHDVQLHTHPSSLFDPNRACMKDYTLTEQVEILKKGIQLLKDFVGEEPLAHRAGDWGANRDTLRALCMAGISVDSSIYHQHPFSEFEHEKLPINDVFSKEGIIQIPPTVYRTYSLGIFEKFRNLDINYSTLQEFRYLLCKTSISPFVVTLHSFSLLGWNDRPYKTIPKRNLYWMNSSSLKKLERILSMIYEGDIMPVTLKEVARFYREDSSFLNVRSQIASVPVYMTAGRFFSVMRSKTTNKVQTWLHGVNSSKMSGTGR